MNVDVPDLDEMPPVPPVVQPAGLLAYVDRFLEQIDRVLADATIGDDNADS